MYEIPYNLKGLCLQDLKVIRRTIKLIEGSAKCRHVKKLTCKGTLRQLFICLRPPPLQGFGFGRSSNFVGSESSQIQTTEYKTPCKIWSPTEPHTLPHPRYTLNTNIQYTSEGERVEPERRGEGQQGRVHKSQS